MDKTFFLIESVLVTVVNVLFNFYVIDTIISRGGIVEYFNTNMFALHAITFTAMFDLLIIFPFNFAFIAMFLGKDSEWCMDVIFYPFTLIDNFFNKK